MVSLHAFVLAAALASSNDLVLLDFGADWCAPCRQMEPTIQRLEGAGYPVRRVNIEQHPDLARQFGIGPIPCFVLVQDGREIQRVVGAASFDRLVQLFAQAGATGRPPMRNGLRGQSPDATFQSPHQPAAPVGGASPASNASPGPQMPRPTPATTAVNDSQLTAAHRVALQATVRLRVTDSAGVSKGTGTIIDVHGNEALVVTCGHIFRESQGKGEIQADLFAAGSPGPVPGHLLLYEADQRDFGLVSIRLNAPVTPVPVATTTYHPQPGEPIFSVGCNHGADPTVRVSEISAVDRYVGQPNIEIHGHPVDGRSGGGLFTSDGRIIGICNAADLQEDRGIYAALPTIHLALDQIGQRAIYMDQGRPPITLAGNTQPPTAPVPAARTSSAAIPATHHTSTSVAPASLMCIFRAADGSAQVVEIKSPSSDLLQRIVAESRQQALPGRAPLPPPHGSSIARLPDQPASSGPLVRAQGY